jgi:hypothetical protein
VAVLRLVAPLARGGGSPEEPITSAPVTKLDKVFTYGIVATQGSRFAHLGMAADDGGGW